MPSVFKSNSFLTFTPKKKAIICMINRRGLIYRREYERLLKILQRTEQQALTLPQAGLLDAKPKHPPLMRPWPPQLPSATAHWAILPCCHHGKTSDLKQTAGKQAPDLHVKVSKPSQVISNSVFTSKQKAVVVGSPARFSCNSLNMTDIWPYWWWC